MNVSRWTPCFKQVVLLLVAGVLLSPSPASAVQGDADRASGVAQTNSAGEPAPQEKQEPRPAVVRVAVAEGEGVMAYGSGTLVRCNKERAVVVTNWHVVRDAAGEISVEFPDGFRSTATVLETDETWDLAALSIAPPKAKPVAIAKTMPERGDELTIAGYGSGTYREATGQVTQYVAPGEGEPFEMVEVHVAARNGDSGGPIFNRRGHLAGVLFGTADGCTDGSHGNRVRWFLGRALGRKRE